MRSYAGRLKKKPRKAAVREPSMSEAKVIREMPSISLCMIVKDEEGFLQPCLDAVKGFVDEMIIVDTGSTDNTVAIGRSAPHAASVRSTAQGVTDSPSGETWPTCRWPWWVKVAMRKPALLGASPNATIQAHPRR